MIKNTIYYKIDNKIFFLNYKALKFSNLISLNYNKFHNLYIYFNINHLIIQKKFIFLLFLVNFFLA